MSEENEVHVHVGRVRGGRKGMSEENEVHVGRVRGGRKGMSEENEVHEVE